MLNWCTDAVGEIYGVLIAIGLVVLSNVLTLKDRIVGRPQI